MKKSDKAICVYKRTLFWVVAGLLIFAPLARGSVHLWSGTIVQIFILTALAILIFKSLKTDALVFRKTILSRPMSGLMVLVFVSVLFSSHKAFAFEGLFMFLSYVVLYYAVIDISRNRVLERQLVYVIIGTAFFIALIGILKRVDMNPFSWWIYPEMGNYKSDYLAGVYVNPNHLAGFLEMVIPMTMVLFITRFRSLEQKFILASIVLVLFIAQAFTLSKGGWVSTIGAMVFLSLILAMSRQLGQKRLVTIIAVCAAVGITVLAATPVVETVSTVTQAHPEDTLDNRLRIWQGASQLARENLILGTGPNTFAIAYPEYQVPGLPILSRRAHNDYLQFASEIGILCLPLIVLILYTFFRYGFITLKIPSRQKQGVTLGGMAGVFAILIHSFYDFNLYVPANAILFTVIAAIASGRVPDN